MSTEADTCRKFVVPKLQAVGWDNDPHSIAELEETLSSLTAVSAPGVPLRELLVPREDSVRIQDDIEYISR